MQQYAVSDECLNMWMENDGVAEGLHDKLLRAKGGAAKAQ